MKSISCHDLKLITALKDFSIFDLVHPKNDHIVHPFLEVMGFDMNKGLMYTVSQHRTLQKTVEVGYVIRGEVNRSRKHLTGPWGTLEDRIMVAGLEDIELCKDLCDRAVIRRLDYSDFNEAYDDGYQDVGNTFPDSLENPDESAITSQIKVLEDILFDLRGDQRRDDGSYKTSEDYRKELLVEETA